MLQVNQTVIIDNPKSPFHKKRARILNIIEETKKSKDSLTGERKEIVIDTWYMCRVINTNVKRARFRLKELKDIS